MNWSLFGTNAKALYGNCIYHIVDVDANQVSDFAVTYTAVFFILSGKEKNAVSIVPSKPDATGLTHFFKKDGDWNFVTADEYEEKKAELPALCFATRHPISNFAERSFPDLSALQVETSGDNGPQYYSKYSYSDETSMVDVDTDVRFATASEREALDGGCTHDMDPLIFIRSTKPIANARDVLPQLKLTHFFDRVENSNEQISFDIVKKDILKAELDQLEIKDKKS